MKNKYLKRYPMCDFRLSYLRNWQHRLLHEPQMNKTKGRFWGDVRASTISERAPLNEYNIHALVFLKLRTMSLNPKP